MTASATSAVLALPQGYKFSLSTPPASRRSSGPLLTGDSSSWEAWRQSGLPSCCWKSTRRIITSTLLRRSYDAAPVSPLFLSERQQDFACQQEVDGNPGKRHHIRFWKCPAGWKLPGGVAVDWLAAASYDRAVGLSYFTLQVTHRISADIDGERDHVVESVLGASPDVSVTVIPDFSSGYHSRISGGDTIRTDGNLPIVDVTQLPAAWEPPDVRSRHRSGVADLAGEDRELFAAADVYIPAEIVLLVFSAFECTLALLILRGTNWARTTAMALSAVSIILQGASVLMRGPEQVLLGDRPAYALDVLILLALSSSRARNFSHAKREGRNLRSNRLSLPSRGRITGPS